MINFLIILISISLGVVGQLLLKHGMLQIGPFPLKELGIKILPMFLNPYVLSGLVSYGISTIFWLTILSRLYVSFAYPMISLGYIIVALYAWIVFKEPVSLIRWAGILTICLGVYLISRS